MAINLWLIDESWSLSRIELERPYTLNKAGNCWVFTLIEKYMENSHHVVVYTGTLLTYLSGAVPYILTIRYCILSPIIMVQRKITLNERKLILEGPIFHSHDYGRKGNV